MSPAAANHWRKFVREMGWAGRRPLLMAASVAIAHGYRPSDVKAIGRSLIDEGTQLFMRDGAACFSSGHFAPATPEPADPSFDLALRSLPTR